MKDKKQKKGLTIIELMVAIFILLMGLTGVFSLITQSIKVRNTNKHQLTASMLAQEGLELVRNVRDNNWLDSAFYEVSEVSNYWKYGDCKEDPYCKKNIVQDGSYIIYIDGEEIKINYSVNNIDDNNARMTMNNDGFFTHENGSGTPYSRIIEINNLDDDFLIVTCRVKWEDSYRGGSYEASTYLYNWR